MGFAQVKLRVSGRKEGLGVPLRWDRRRSAPPGIARRAKHGRCWVFLPGGGLCPALVALTPRRRLPGPQLVAPVSV